jgi:VWFA-related protein
MGEKRRIVFLFFLLWLLSECIWAAEPGRFAISQLSARPPVVTVYLDVLDENGQPPLHLAASQLSATIQGQSLKVTQATSFEASGEGVAYIFLVDISKSIGPTQFAQIRQAIDAWIDGLNSVDRMAIFTFGEQYKQLVGFTADKTTLKSVLQNLKPTDPQTKLYLALSNAMNLGREITKGLPNRRVIVILSDGKDEGSGINAEDVRELIQQSHVPIYAMGYSRLPSQERKKYLEVLNRLATLSGGTYTAAASLKTAYEEMQSAIRRVFVVQLACAGCSTDSQLHPLAITLASGAVARTSSQNVNVIAPPPPVTPPDSWLKTAIKFAISWKGILSLVLVVGIGFGVVFHVEIKRTLWPPLEHEIERVEKEVVKFETGIVTDAVVPKVGRRVQLTVLAGKEHGRVDYINLVAKSVIGRDQQCDVSFPDDTEMSAKHCELQLADRYVEVTDLGSTNGTFLNGAQLVARQRLEDGDLLRAGRTEFRINIGGAT